MQEGCTLKYTWAIFTMILLSACAPVMAQDTPPTIDPGSIRFVGPEALPTSAFEDERLQKAEANYQVFCAHCHGYAGEGQAVGAPGETARLGYQMVPAHDSKGITWKFADPLLFEVIKFGITNPLDHYPMIGFDLVMTDDEIMALVDYMKFWWTPEQRAYNAYVTENHIRAREEAGSPVYRLDETPTP